MTITAAVNERPAGSRPKRWPWVLLVLAVVVSVGIPASIWFGHWRSNLHSFTDYPTYGMSGSLPLGETRYLGANLISMQTINHPSRLTELSVHVSDIRPTVVADTADAEIVVLRCVLAADGPGPVAEDSTTRCAGISRFRSGDLRLGYRRGDDDLVLAVRLRTRGAVRIAGLQVRYSSGLRHGTQHVGVQAGAWSP